jgi:hypothetical protein
VRITIPALLASLALAACNPRELAGVACPILAPGATQALPRGPALDAFGGVASASGSLDQGGMVVHALYAPAGTTLRVTAQVEGARGLLMLYGPRDGHGGYPYCASVALARGAGERVQAQLGPGEQAGGEFLAMLGARPGEQAGAYTIEVACAAGCDAAQAACPTLHDLGCPDLRCDGDLVRDAGGCLTCECRADALCSAARRAGPWGVCVRPGCLCDEAAPAPVCGIDGQTWPSACQARCAGVGVAVEGACETACPELSSCADPCRGARRIDTASGCPTCKCAPQVPEQAADCLACPLDATPVCGSDGVSYTNRCAARCAGARILYAASCAASCRKAPAGCSLECPWGLKLTGAATPDQGECLACTCVGGPNLDCLTSIAPWCVTVPGLSDPVTVGASCIGTALGVAEVSMQRGPCGVACEGDAECPDGTACQRFGVLQGRCLYTAPDAPLACGCSAIEAPVCGADAKTYPNACLAACAGSPIVHEGSCCAAQAPACPAGEAAPLDRSGCEDATAACAPVPTEGCLEGEPLAGACTADGAGVEGSACSAHLAGVDAAPGWCGL